MNEPYREWWMDVEALKRLHGDIQVAIDESIRGNHPLWTALPKAQGLIDGLIEFVPGYLKS